MPDPIITLSVSGLPTLGTVGTSKIEEAPIALDAVELDVSSTLPVATVSTLLKSVAPVYAKEYYYYDVGVFTSLWYYLTGYGVNISHYVYSWILTSLSTYVTKIEYASYYYKCDNMIDVEVHRVINSVIVSKSFYNIEVRRLIKNSYLKR